MNTTTPATCLCGKTTGTIVIGLMTADGTTQHRVCVDCFDTIGDDETGK